MAEETSAAERARARTISPLRGLWPFVRPYRGLLWGALAALTVTAGLSLSLPLAVRRVIDNFFAEELRIVDAYFLAALGIAALLAVGTAARF
jgi:ATP-binding cassette subfamily B protein